MDGLIIKKQFLDKIFSGVKTWELRGSKTHKRGRIALIESGSGKVMGECYLLDCIGPLDEQTFSNNSNKHCSSSDFKDKTYKNLFAWVLKDAKRYSKPHPYNHPSGAIIWVKLQNTHQQLLD